MLSGPAANPPAKTDTLAALEPTGLLDAQPAVVTGAEELVACELDVVVGDVVVDDPSVGLLVVLAENAMVLVDPAALVALEASDDDPFPQPPAMTRPTVRAIAADRRGNPWPSIDPHALMASPRCSQVGS